jgi:hypothetical protein
MMHARDMRQTASTLESAVLIVASATWCDVG